MKPVLIWDWDGTLLDSLSFKYKQIWDYVFAEEPTLKKIVVEYIKTAKGKEVNRYGLIQYALSQTSANKIHTQTTDSHEDNQLVTHYAHRYAEALDSQLPHLSLFPGAVETLAYFHEKGQRQYLVSGGGTDDDLERMTVALGVRNFFDGVFGFGGSAGMTARFGKQENFERIQSLDTNKHFVVIGDSESDRSFADEVGVEFIGIASVWNGWSADNKSIVSTLRQIPHILS